MVEVQKPILHYPRLDTVLMIEKFIKENSGDFKKSKLWKSLPKKVMYQTFCVVIDYLIESGKVGVDREGHIAWIYNPELVKKYTAGQNLLWRS